MRLNQYAFSQTCTSLDQLIVKPGIHLRTESEINVDRIFKERVDLRELYHYRESLR